MDRLQVVCMLLWFVCTALGKHEEFKVSSAEMANTINTLNVGWEATIYKQFAGMDWVDAKQMLGSYGAWPNESPPKVFKEDVATDIPDSFDARVKWPGSIHDIRDQGACGSCWAFGASEVLSDRFAIVSNNVIDVVLSAQQLVDCDTRNSGCEGGWPLLAWQYIQEVGSPENLPFWAFFTVTVIPLDDKESPKWLRSPKTTMDTQDMSLGHLSIYEHKNSCQRLASLLTVECYGPYTAKGGECKFNGTVTSQCPSGSGVLKAYHSKNAYAVGQNVEAIQTEIMTNGPVEATFTVYQDFYSYKSGVYSHVTGGAVGGHAIKMLGWGSEGGVDYWICANSWGEGWGMDGFFLIRRGTDECGIEGGVTAGVPDMSR